MKGSGGSVPLSAAKLQPPTLAYACAKRGVLGNDPLHPAHPLEPVPPSVPSWFGVWGRGVGERAERCVFFWKVRGGIRYEGNRSANENRPHPGPGSIRRNLGLFFSSRAIAVIRVFAERLSKERASKRKGLHEARALGTVWVWASHARSCGGHIEGGEAASAISVAP